ncbi:SUKH-3 domain-containing protein [Listeria cossartiae subsp. cayugensis]|uniref:SUKH-3 domain-containing protein n=1 Tax=Listeria cossartiae TaxID=2838249 RepID=UPI00287FFA89|nr:SUKH-3 domain-containing protein [Listeria cossartiae]MDT0002856.1 SUKH-3 domain-containing protein [Listeria cossartiae subsp. cayugensis]MDT0018776.1 SUKH-3 domain-containing protein [Listeria cossartiae subsp. cayugensis]MDT0035651.1 SUKH-3 domain-containing protein [Listeria cossartiae subsp. cayugensis]MDT0040526.1 SUKH-3 domain-containing protein [Listeria cossartiae subsp. cayugensis]MDT0046353.1 SUKH-3 domain-containing protein [Listeria cossartiae subsp. cayugensis]
MNYTFDEQVTNILRKNGWYSDRFININNYRRILEEKNYYLNQGAEKFLSNLGGLIIKHEAYSGINDTDVSGFDPTKPAAWLDPKWVKECYEDIIKEKLYPVGVGFSEHMVFFVSESGGFYGGYDDYFCLIGDSVESGLLNLFNNHNFISLN